MEEWIYNPNQSYGLDSSAYDLSSSYTGGNLGGITYNPAPSAPGSYDLGYDPSYQFTGVKYDPSNNWGGDLGTVSTGATTNTPWWDSAPSMSYQSPFVGNTGYDFGYQPSFTLGAGSAGAPTNTGGVFGGVTAGTGSGAQLAPGLGGAGTGSFATAPTSGNTGVTGSFGMMDEMGPGAPGSVGRQAYDASFRNTPVGRGLSTVGDAVSTGAGAVGRGLSAVGQYAQQNPWAARFAVDAAGMGLNYMAQRDANKLAREQLQMQREAQAKNTAMADRLNAEATQSLNEARSNFNPQEMGIRAMADTKAATNRAIAENTAAMRRSGMSQAAIDAETRRARLGGTTGATTAYTKGLDVGRQAQQSALTSAKGLTQQYGGTPDYSGARMVSEAGRLTAQQSQNLLNTYLQNPVARTDLEMQRNISRGVNQ